MSNIYVLDEEKLPELKDKSAERVVLPHKFEPRGYQMGFMKTFRGEMKKPDGIRKYVLVWHRRAGKDKTVVNTIISEMLRKKGTYYYMFPTYEQGHKVIWTGADRTGMKFLDHFPHKLIAEKNETRMMIKLVNGSVFQVVGADKIDRAMGTNPIGVVFSEYSLMKSNVYEYLSPILAENNGFAVFVYTARGKNHGWSRLQIAKANNQDYYWELITVDDTNAISDKVLEQEKKEHPKDFIDQEYYNKFIDGASSVFTRIKENTQEMHPVLKRGGRYQIGVDLAKHQDYTVITVVSLNTFDVLKQMRFNKVDWNQQKEAIIKEARYWHNAKVVMDSTGLGDVVYDDLLNEGLTVEPYTFSYKSREQLLNNIKLLLEMDKIKLPDDGGLREELESFQYELVGDKVKMQVPDGLHDDRVMSLGLAVWGLNNMRPLKYRKRKKKERPVPAHAVGLTMRGY